VVQITLASSTAGLGGGGYNASGGPVICIEAVLQRSAPIIIKPNNAKDLEALKRLGNAVVRIDQLANRVSFTRMMFATTVITAAAAADATESGFNAFRAQMNGEAPQFSKEKPAVEIAEALTLSLLESGASVRGLCGTLAQSPITGRSFHPATGFARCAFFGRILHSRMPLDPTHVRLKRTRV
jgi:hypothetical protein